MVTVQFKMRALRGRIGAVVLGTASVERNRIPSSILSPPGPETCFLPRGYRKSVEVDG